MKNEEKYIHLELSLLLYIESDKSITRVKMADCIQFGMTDLTINRHGFGAARIGEGIGVDGVRSLFNVLREEGINFVDTADCYVDSETLIGQCIKDGEDDFIIASKCGCLCDGEEGIAYTPEIIERSIDRSLQRMGLECVDLVYLHTCSADVLRAGQAVEALLKAKESGKVRYVGYSGDGDDALCAIELGVFDALQVTFNIVDQSAIRAVLPQAAHAGMGIVAKRPIANARMLLPEMPHTHDGPYWEPVHALLAEEGLVEDPLEWALRFTLSHSFVHSAIVGTTNPDHVRENARRVAGGPLSERVLGALYRLNTHDA